MQLQTTTTAPAKRQRAPKIVISADYLPRLEDLAEGAMNRNPLVAEKLLREIGRARIVAHAKMPETVVSIGSTVTYQDDDTGQHRTIVLVFPADANIGEQKISVMTPIGVALLGLGEGASFHWDTRDNQRKTLTVLNVRQVRGSRTEDV